MPAPAEVQAATIESFIEGWRKWTPEDYLATWSDDCQQKMRPFTMQTPPRSVAEVKQVLPSLMTVVTNYELDIHEVVRDAAQSKAVIYATSRGDTIFDDFKWTNEYTVFLTLTEDGRQISRFDEMIDTAFFQQFFPKFQAYMAQQHSAK